MHWLRRGLIALGVLALLAGVVLVALLVLVNPNDYKGALQQAVHERYNRTLVIDGDIKLSLLPRLGLEVSGVSLSEPDSTQVFAAIDTARVAVAWWPLLSRHLVIEHLTVGGVKANVVRDAEGRFNFQDLLASPQADQDAATRDAHDGDKPSVQLDIGGITLADGEIALRDDVYDMAIRMGRLGLSASNISFGESFDFNLSGRVLGQNPRADATVQLQGAMLLDPRAASYAVRNLDLRVAGVLPSVRANTFSVRGNAAYDAAAGAIDVGGLAIAFQGDIGLSTPLTGVEAQISAPRILANPARDQLTLEKLGVKVTGRMDNVPFTLALDAPGLQITENAASGGAVKAAFTREGPQPLAVRLTTSEVTGNAARFEIANMQWNAQIKQAARNTELAATSALSASLKSQTFSLPGLDARFNITDAALPGGRLEVPVTGKLDLDLSTEKVSGALKAALEGGLFDTQFSVNGFAKPSLQFTVVADTVDVDKLWPGKPVAQPAQVASGAGAKNGESRNGQPEAGFDLSALNRLDARGTVKVADLTARGVRARDVAATLRLADGRAVVSGISARIFEGGLSGELFADAGSHQFGVKAAFTDVAVRPLLQAFADYDDLSGKGSLKADLTATGKNAEALRNTLGGNINVNLRDGQFRGINIAESLRDFKSMLGRNENAEQAADTARTTDFTELRASLALRDGVGALRDLYVAAPLLRITEGSPNTVDLAKQRFNLVINAKVVNTSTGQGGKALNELRDVTIPVHLTGPLNAPAYAIQWREVGSEALERTLKNEAKRQLDRLLEGRRPPAESEGGSEGNSTGKILGEALKGLFNQ